MLTLKWFHLYLLTIKRLIYKGRNVNLIPVINIEALRHATWTCYTKIKIVISADVILDTDLYFLRLTLISQLQIRGQLTQTSISIKYYNERNKKYIYIYLGLSKLYRHSFLKTRHWMKISFSNKRCKSPNIYSTYMNIFIFIYIFVFSRLSFLSSKCERFCFH